jgi:hypothetical protein
MKKFAPIFFLAATLCAQDVIHYTDGSMRTNKIAAAEGSMLRIVIPSPVPGQPGGSALIPRVGISKIIFGPDPMLDTVAAQPVPGSVASARSRWQNLQPLLGTPESRAGEAGCLYGQILLQMDDPARHDEALEVFKTVETGSWKVEDRQRATRGRLSALIKKGKLEEASQEAEEIARSADSPELLVETKLLLGQARMEALKTLLADNPRWKEDPPVVKERDRLLNEGLDFALYPFLFNGTETEEAAEGLWVARGLYELADQPSQAAEVLQDIVDIYPRSRRAKEAAALVGGGDRNPGEAGEDSAAPEEKTP